MPTAKGKRIKKTQGSSTTLYFGKDLEIINNTLTLYAFAGNLRIARMTAAGTEYYHKDHQGSTKAITTDTGTILDTAEYLPYGPDRSVNALLNRSAYKYTDQEQDAGTGLYNYDARLYDPALGQFVMADTIVPDPFNPHSLNRYAYCLNNPIRYTDPTGHQLGSNGSDYGGYDGTEHGASTAAGMGLGGNHGYASGDQPDGIHDCRPSKEQFNFQVGYMLTQEALSRSYDLEDQKIKEEMKAAWERCEFHMIDPNLQKPDGIFAYKFTPDEEGRIASVSYRGSFLRSDQSIQDMMTTFVHETVHSMDVQVGNYALRDDGYIAERNAFRAQNRFCELINYPQGKVSDIHGLLTTTKDHDGYGLSPMP